MNKEQQRYIVRQANTWGKKTRDEKNCVNSETPPKGKQKNLLENRKETKRKEPEI